MVKVSVLFLLSSTTSVPVRPVTATLILYSTVFAQVTATVMSEVIIPEELLPIVHVCPVG